MPVYPQAVERWRPLVAKYFKPEDVDKALWVIQHESGGDANAVNATGGEFSVGLFQLNSEGGLGSGMTEAARKDPLTNIRKAAQAVYGGSGWGPWGENNTRADGSTFGSLGDHPYPGDSGSAYPPPPAPGGAMTGPNDGTADMERRQELEAEGERLLDTLLSGDLPYEKRLDVLENLNFVLGEISRIDERWMDIDDRSNREAQTRFENAIDIGDFQQTQADRAFERWMAKRDRAVERAQGEVGAALERNEQNAALEAARRENYGQGPVGETSTYLPPNYQDALAKWERRMGTGAEPSGDFRDYPSPAEPPRFQFTDLTPGGGGGQISPPRSGILREPVGGTDARTAPGIQRAMDVLDQRPRPSFQREPVPEDWQSKAKALPGQAAGATWMAGAKMGEMMRRGAQGGQQAGGQAKAWWRQLMHGQIPGWEMPGMFQDRGLPGVLNVIPWRAEGTPNAEGGPTGVGEKGPETVITPDGQVVPVGQQGPEIRDIQQGSAILPNGVPPEEAYMFTEVQRALSQPDPTTTPEAALERMNDPNLHLKVVDSLLRAIAAQDASRPPNMPQLVGPGWDFDPWEKLRPLAAPPEMEVM